ncbi:hypothetical protein BM613_13285 [Sulfoacidibacillus thermotolerans]|uniref:Transglycosylase SLT domain-containing protein n=1 Tax=Sulfoacidibacillus thermotolerans TaxID=1765684 RepID=A0A2U3D3H7_SULT2|nr:hypothetical protein BM613_13285 [Sulfoacidibacillus thermotolerans]
MHIQTSRFANKAFGSKEFRIAFAFFATSTLHPMFMPFPPSPLVSNHAIVQVAHRPMVALPKETNLILAGKSRPHHFAVHVASPFRVRAVIAQALEMTHEPISWLSPLCWIAKHESNDHPHAIAYREVGDESACGLFQVLPTTFAAHALPAMQNIWNPLDNAVAAIRYIAGRYKTPWAVPHVFCKATYVGY